MSHEDPTQSLRGADDVPTGVLPGGDDGPTEPMPVSADQGNGKGVWVLVVSVIASVLLIGGYVAAGGPVGPDKGADPCDPRPWTDPSNLEETAQQFTLSAADGAACALGVSREELIRALPDDQTRLQFMEENGFSDSDMEEALRAGLNRAVDDGENAGVISGLPAMGIRAAIRVMPMSVMIGLLENADSIFNGDLSSLGGIGDAIEAITGGFEGLQSGSTDDPLGGLGGALEGILPEGTTDALEGIVPEGAKEQLQDQAREKLKQGLNDLLAP